MAKEEGPWRQRHPRKVRTPPKHLPRGTAPLYAPDRGWLGLAPALRPKQNPELGKVGRCLQAVLQAAGPGGKGI